MAEDDAAMSSIKKPTLVEPVALPGNPTMAYLDAKYAYHAAWSDYYGAKADQNWRRALICMSISGGLFVVAVISSVIGAIV